MKMQKVKLGDILVLQPKSKIKAGEGKKAGEFPFFTSSKIQDKFINIAIYSQPSLIFGTGGEASVHFYNGSFATSTDCLVFNLESNQEINLKYVFYYLCENIDLIESGFHGCGLKHISKTYILDITIFLPNIEQQNKLVKIFDNFHQIENKRKEQIKKLDLLIKSRFIEMFGTEEEPKYKIIEISNFAKVWSSKRIYANEYVEKGIPFYRSKEIRELGDGFSPSTELFISIDRYNDIKMKFGIPKKGDILIAAIGATIGFLWQINTDNPFYYKDGNLICISDMKNNNSTYIRFALSKAIDKIKKKSVYGTAQIALTIEKVEKIKLSIPPIELQNEFAEFVEKTDKIKQTIKTHLEKLETLKKSLMQQYFG